MANRFVLKHSAVATSAPLPADLVEGEVALNTADRKLYFKDTSGNIQVLLGTAASDVVVEWD
jgi:hypothetical protein